MESSRYDCSCDRWSQRNRVRLSSVFALHHYLTHCSASFQHLDCSKFRFAIVEELAAFGAKVHVCDISETLLNQSLNEWQKKGFQVSGSVCDVSSRPERETLMQTVSSLFGGKLNVLVSNLIFKKPIKLKLILESKTFKDSTC